MQRRQVVVSESGNLPFPDENLVKTCPLLAAHLADEFWDDGTGREPSTLTIRCEDGRINAALNDREERSSLYVTADSIPLACKALEKQLGLSNADWRRWSGDKKKRKA